MSEVVVSKVTNVAGDYFIDAAQPGSIIQVQAYDYSSVYTNTDIQNKRKSIEKEIDDELEKAQSEIVKLKTNSLKDIEKISEALAGKIVEEITGDKLNESNVRAVVSDNSKKNLSKFI